MQRTRVQRRNTVSEREREREEGVYEKRRERELEKKERKVDIREIVRER